MPIDYGKYPKNWREIRKRILKRDGNKCKWCGVPNLNKIRRDECDKWSLLDGKTPNAAWIELGIKPVYIVLTVAHLDHNRANNADDNLAALCQRCHLRHDAKQHAHNARITRAERAGQRFLIEAERI